MPSHRVVSDGYTESLQARHLDKAKWGDSVNKYASGDVLGLIITRGYIQTVLDFGSGKGGLKKFLHKTAPGVQVTEYDPGVKGKDRLPEIKKLSDRFDLVVTCDVLEHVEPDCIDATLEYLFNATKTVMYNNICCKLTEFYFDEGPFKGQDLHLSVHEPIWWKERFATVITDPKCSLMEFRHIERRASRDVGRLRCTMIHERSG